MLFFWRYYHYFPPRVVAPPKYAKWARKKHPQGALPFTPPDHMPFWRPRSCPMTSHLGPCQPSLEGGGGVSRWSLIGDGGKPGRSLGSGARGEPRPSLSASQLFPMGCLRQRLNSGRKRGGGGGVSGTQPEGMRFTDLAVLEPRDTPPPPHACHTPCRLVASN